MENQIVELKKLSLSALSSFVKIYCIGLGSLIVSFVVGLVILLHSTGGQGAHTGGESAIIVMFTSNPIQCILLLIILSSLFFIVSFATSYVVQKTVYRIVQEKSENTLIPILDKIIQQCQENQASELKSLSDFALAKKKVIQNLQSKPENKWIKKIILYYLKKVQINESHLTLSDKDLFDLIRQKAVDSLNSISAPSKTIFWLIVTLHWTIVLFIYLT